MPLGPSPRQPSRRRVGQSRSRSDVNLGPVSSLRPPSDGGFVSRLVPFVLVSVLWGLLVAGVTLPVVGGLGRAARGGADGFESLPAELTIPPLAERSRILASDGSLIAT